MTRSQWILLAIAMALLLAITNLMTAAGMRGYVDGLHAERAANPSICQTGPERPDWKIGQAVYDLQACMALMERRWLDRFGR